MKAAISVKHGMCGIIISSHLFFMTKARTSLRRSRSLKKACACWSITLSTFIPVRSFVKRTFLRAILWMNAGEWSIPSSTSRWMSGSVLHNCHQKERSIWQSATVRKARESDQPNADWPPGVHRFLWQSDRLLRRRTERIEFDKYPPEGMEDAVKTVIEQCEMWTDNADNWREGFHWGAHESKCFSSSLHLFCYLDL